MKRKNAKRLKRAAAKLAKQREILTTDGVGWQRRSTDHGEVDAAIRETERAARLRGRR